VAVIGNSLYRLGIGIQYSHGLHLWDKHLAQHVILDQVCLVYQVPTIIILLIQALHAHFLTIMVISDVSF